MSNEISGAYRELLEKPVVVSLATVMPDGSPQVNPVWCAYDGNHILVNTAKGRQKDRNMRARPQVTVLATNPENPYQYIEVRGVVDGVTNDGAEELIDDLAEQYINQRPYPYRQEGEERVIFKIKPLRVHTVG